MIFIGNSFRLSVDNFEFSSQNRLATSDDVGEKNGLNTNTLRVV